jgi:hypothetical protein
MFLELWYMKASIASRILITIGNGMEIPNIKGCSSAPAVVAGITTTDARCSIFQHLLVFCTRRKLDRHLSTLRLHLQQIVRRRLRNRGNSGGP